ncbi:MAG: xylulokinase [Flexilinea sp.]
MNFLLGIDLGTTSLKVSLYSESGQRIGSESFEYPLLVPQPGYAEQDPPEWWDALVKACHKLKDAFPKEFQNVAGIGICGQMHTQVYLDAHGHNLCPAITWMDQRSSAIVDRYNRDSAAKELIYENTANAATTTYSAMHIRWMKENRPEIWEKVDSILLAKDYLKYRLTGQKAVDFADAAGTLLFDVRREAWSQPMFDLFEIPRRFFPEVGPSDQVIGTVSAEAAKLTGLKSGIPVINGSSDNSASALGSGMISSGQVTLIIGTAGCITVCSDKPLPDPLNRTLCWHYCLQNYWVTLGIMQTAGGSLEWFKKAFDQSGAPGGDIFNRYNESIRDVPDGCKGLIFLPYLNGERTPYWDSNARGVFFGINLETEKSHFIKAIMEGVSFALRNNIETVESLGIEINDIRAAGGGLKSQVWLDILGKITRKPITTITGQDTANLGNIILCGKAIGLFDSYKDTISRFVTTDRIVSYPDGSEIYEKQYPLFLELYHDLKPAFKKAAG